MAEACSISSPQEIVGGSRREDEKSRVGDRVFKEPSRVGALMDVAILADGATKLKPCAVWA